MDGRKKFKIENYTSYRDIKSCSNSSTYFFILTFTYSFMWSKGCAKHGVCERGQVWDNIVCENIT